MQNGTSFTFKGKQHFLLDIFSVINLRQTGTCHLSTAGADAGIQAPQAAQAHCSDGERVTC